MPESAEQAQFVARMEVVDQEMVRIWRGKSPAERLAIGNLMWRFARDTLWNLLRAQHPDWSAEQVAREAARRLSHGTG